jgi:hypothetical protein
MSFKKTKVVMLPTNEKAILGFLTQKGKERAHLVHFDRPMPNILDSENQHLYFLSDEEIKVGDWGISKLNEIVQFKKNYESTLYKKIIATTDKSLFINGFIGYTYTGGKSAAFSHKNLPQPSQSFIEKFVEEYNEGNVITEVLVEYEEGKYNLDELRERHLKGLPHSYDYCNLKINPKDNTITIRKVKDSWNREEVEQLLIKHQSNYRSHVRITNDWSMDIKKWIEENL